ncbi:MAG: calcium/sodium antiporter [Gammaproteobacteria bacterium]|nr:calcium/sodium antiporter [Gammaproteobacteria bacterium]
MLIDAAAVVMGLALLVWSADRFVDGAASLARLLGVSTLIIGIVIVGFGTSAPEIGVSVIAALDDSPGLAIGNALGSNIANIGLILGVTAIIAPIPVHDRLFKSEFPLLLFATAVMAACLVDLRLGPIDGVVLLALLGAALYYLVRDHRRHPVDYARLDHDQLEFVDQSGVGDEPGMGRAIGWLLVGLLVLIGSSRLLVWGASNIASTFGVSELVIGLTIVALGTSLPELAASIASLKQNVPDVAIGNVIGSNLFNSLAVIGLPALITEFSIDQSARARDLSLVIALTLGLVLMARFPSARPRFLGRLRGIVLFGAFVIYQLSLYHEIAAR